LPHYTLSWTDPRQHLLDVSIRFTALDNDPLLWLPAWRPGRYLIQNYAANVREWSSNLRKVGKSEWRVEANAGDEVVITYRYYAGTLDAGSSFLDDDEAYVNGSNLLMCVDALRGQESLLTIAAPAEWRIETQLPRDDDGVFHARDYDHLIDSPVIAAETMTRHSFVESDARIHFIVRGDVDFEKYVEPMRAVVRAQAALFGGLPFRDYRFLIHAGDRWHGVEHEESSSLIIKRFDDDDQVVSLCSHELFHVWNVKRIVPAAFKPYDYLHETPTRLLWAMEGITSYYGDLMLVRAGVWDAAQFVEHLRKEIEPLENAAGRHHLSLAQAGFDSWLQEQMPEKLSFYNKGEIVAALLDLTIRSTTSASLDDVMRLLWRGYGETARGLEEDGVERAVAAIAGEQLARDFFARYVDGTDPLPYAELFARVAVAFESVPSDDVSFDGLLPGDEVIAIDGVRTATRESLGRVLRSVAVGEAIDVIVSRAGFVSTRTLVARRDPHVSTTLRIDGESALRDDWLRRTE